MSAFDLLGELKAVAEHMRNRADVRGSANAGHLHEYADQLEGLIQTALEGAAKDANPWGKDPADLGPLAALVDRLRVVPLRAAGGGK